MNEKVNKIFKVMPCNEEQTEFVVIIGRHLATEKRFATKKEAEDYMKKPKWDTIIAVVAEMLELDNKTEKK